MQYAPLPARPPSERRNVWRAVGALHATAARIDRILGDRAFRVKLLVTLNVLDLFTTAVVLANGGAEGNPLMVGVVQHWWMPIVVKAGVLAVVGLIVVRCPLRSPIADALLIVAWLFYGLVVLWNTVIILSL